MNKEIYILLSRLPDSGSKAFGLFSASYYTHASIGLMENKALFYSFQIKGFVQENLKKYLEKGKKEYPCEVYRIRVEDEKYCMIKNLIIRFCNQRTRYRYTRLGVAMSIFRIAYRRKDYYFCSQFVAELLQEARILSLKKEAELYLPKHFRSLPEFEKIYAGNIGEWCAI